MNNKTRKNATEVFGRNLKTARKSRGASQEDLAEACGLHRTEISLLERGLREPRLLTLARLADLLDVSIDDLRQGVDLQLPNLGEVCAERAAFRAERAALRDFMREVAA